MICVRTCVMSTPHLCYVNSALVLCQLSHLCYVNRAHCCDQLQTTSAVQVDAMSSNIMLPSSRTVALDVDAPFTPVRNNRNCQSPASSSASPESNASADGVLTSFVFHGSASGVPCAVESGQPKAKKTKTSKCNEKRLDQEMIKAEEAFKKQRQQQDMARVTEAMAGSIPLTQKLLMQVLKGEEGKAEINLSQECHQGRTHPSLQPHSLFGECLQQSSVDDGWRSERRQWY